MDNEIKKHYIHSLNKFVKSKFVRFTQINS